MPEYRFSGAKLKEVREAADLSQAQLSARIDRSQPLIALWELGYQDPPAAKLVELAAVLDVDVSSFFNGVSEVPA